MTQGSRLFDELGKLMNNAAGVADGVRREIETAVKSQLERMINDMDLVKLEDYYALLIANHLLAGAEAFVAA